VASEDYLYKFGDDALDGAGEQLVPGVLPQQRTHRHLVEACAGRSSTAADPSPSRRSLCRAFFHSSGPIAISSMNASSTFSWTWCAAPAPVTAHCT